MFSGAALAVLSIAL